MTKTLMVMLAGLLAVPAGLAAQLAVPKPTPVMLTPYFGFRFGYTYKADESLTSGGATTNSHGETAVGTVPLVGVNAQLHIAGPWSLEGDLAYAEASTATATIYTAQGAAPIAQRWGGTVLGGAAIEFELPNPDPLTDGRLHKPSATLFAGPAVVIRRPYEQLALPSYLTGSVMNYAAHFGLRAASNLPWSDHVGFELVGEDYMTFWNDSQFSTDNTNYFRAHGMTDATDVISSKVSHIFMVHVGLTFRFL